MPVAPGGPALRVVQPARLEDVLRLYAAQGRVEGRDEDPYWAAVWESATVLGAELLGSAAAGGGGGGGLGGLVAGQAVLDLGCGLGTAGVCAGLAGAAHVTLADREPLALRCGLLTAAASGLAVPLPPPSPPAGAPALPELAWEEESPPLFGEEPRGPPCSLEVLERGGEPGRRPRRRRGRWWWPFLSRRERAPPAASAVQCDFTDLSSLPAPPPGFARFGAVLASDVLYEPGYTRHVAAALRELLDGPNGAPMALVADPAGRHGPQQLERLCDLAGLAVADEVLRRPPDGEAVAIRCLVPRPPS